jgi:hypothetical protein
MDPRRIRMFSSTISATPAAAQDGEELQGLPTREERKASSAAA